MNIKGNARLAGESFEDYRKRLKQEAKDIKKYLKGDCFWMSAVFGTYDQNRNKTKWAMKNGYDLGVRI